MINYYRVPHQINTIQPNQRLKLNDDSDIKDAIYNQTIQNIKILSFKNSNVKD
jgi:DNA-directed RNA polymerase subunit L